LRIVYRLAAGGQEKQDSAPPQINYFNRGEMEYEKKEVLGGMEIPRNRCGSLEKIRRAGNAAIKGLPKGR